MQNNSCYPEPVTWQQVPIGFWVSGRRSGEKASFDLTDPPSSAQEHEHSGSKTLRFWSTMCHVVLPAEWKQSGSAGPCNGNSGTGP